MVMSASMASGTGMNIPEVTLKLAVDKNGAVDDLSLDKSERFTSEESLDAVHRLRKASEAIIVGVGTIKRDNPSLTVRRVPLDEDQRPPVRVVLDGRLSIAENEEVNVLKDGNPTIVFFSEMPTQAEQPTNTQGETYEFTRYGQAANLMLGCLGAPVAFKELPLDRSNSFKDGNFMLDAMWNELGAMGMARNSRVMLEGGPETAKKFLSQGQITRAIIIKADVEFKDPVPSGIDEEVLKSAGLEFVGTTKYGPDTAYCWKKAGTEWPQGGIESWP
eukprot:CAMPEP_0113939926 /NCGR_PEP_ID=MMETSP1339-20121228/6145_1 /TAXON_ID=94617 /ORGANISM="Fibrocapsa japonica" /LENGTH=274 /DNA_ID=CAMNT_0000943571 /DNA_START=157 /DNA_END=981 /DNA_ORIENTATION=- /assembly_acc=CAM_ASM_000762